MARYEVPTVYYQSSINADTAVEVTHIKSLSWSNRTNNNSSFELIIPMDSEFTPFEPKVDGFLRLDPGDTIMQIEKTEKIFDKWGNYWYKLGGRAKQSDDDLVRDAKNNDYFFRYIYNGVNSEQFKRFDAGTPVTTINKGDILESSTYGDNLGGFFEEVMTDPGKPEVPGWSWGTTVTGQPKVVVNSVNTSTVVSVTVGSNANLKTNPAPGVLQVIQDPRAGVQYHDIISRSTHTLFTTTNMPTPVSVGSASGPNGRMDRTVYSGSWIKNDVTNDVVVTGRTVTWEHWNFYESTTVPFTFSAQGQAIIPIRTITLKTDAEYQAEMQAYLNSIPNHSGTVATVPAVPPTFRRTYVQGGHAGYSFKLKAKGEVEKRYKVDFNLGDTIRVNDTRLNVVYDGVVSGAVETIDGNGYNVEIEIGTLGATLEQRVQRVI